MNGAIEGQMFKKTGNLTRLSVQNLVDCSKPHGNNGCDWGDPYIAYEYVLHNGGVEAEATYPYEGKVSGHLTLLGVWGNCRDYNPLPSELRLVGRITLYTTRHFHSLLVR